MFVICAVADDRSGRIGRGSSETLLTNTREHRESWEAEQLESVWTGSLTAVVLVIFGTTQYAAGAPSEHLPRLMILSTGFALLGQHTSP
jgi:hypothetical protein